MQSVQPASIPGIFFHLTVFTNLSGLAWYYATIRVIHCILRYQYSGSAVEHVGEGLSTTTEWSFFVLISLIAPVHSTVQNHSWCSRFSRQTLRLHVSLLKPYSPNRHPSESSSHNTKLFIMPTSPRSKPGLFPSLWFSVFIIKCGVSAYTAVPRWGQAAVLINSDLYIYGGKTDQFNAFSYTSAQNNNDLLYLSLLSPFDSDSPPWQLVASSTNITTPQGPALSWHTLSAFNTSEVLLFGGQPGPNSPTVIVDAANSALLLDVFSRLEPVWITEATGWALEPPRRIHHTAITASSGLIFIIGGEKVDGSGNALADHYVFDINTPSFSRISSGNGPPDITGHGSVILPDGKLLVFGGYCQSQSQLLPFSTIWVLDTTQPTLVWTSLPVSNSPLPSPRRAFVSVLLADGRVLIQGGSDASLQNNFPDGWILDVSQSLAVWTQIDALEQVGPRRDHFAVASGDQVIFGFGYGNSGPASAPLIVYDVPSSTFNSTFTPPSSPPTSMTMPGPSQTQGSNSPTGGHTSDGIHPTATIGSNPNGGDSGGGKDKKSTVAIVVGTVVGILSLIAVGVAGVFYMKRRRVHQEEERRFITLNQDDENDDNSRLGAGIPVAGPIGGGHRGRNFGMLHSIGLASIVAAATGGRSMRGEQQRRDMLLTKTRENSASGTMSGAGVPTIPGH
ncbi:hypothetical protein BD779DRAFT_589193 [Infundibulicybe gibba]|nr:hypothetical protein BD779DRAFT_589193 [Infundibulicybe gibba]